MRGQLFVLSLKQRSEVLSRGLLLELVSAYLAPGSDEASAVVVAAFGAVVVRTVARTVVVVTVAPEALAHGVAERDVRVTLVGCAGLAERRGDLTPVGVCSVDPTAHASASCAVAAIHVVRITRVRSHFRAPS